MEEKINYMSLLLSYSYGIYCGVDKLPTDVLGLFSELVTNPEKKLQYTSEIISGGLNGKINFNYEFKLDAYEAKIRKNEKLVKNAKGKKELFLDYGSGSDDSYNDVSRKGGIVLDSSSDSHLMKVEDAYNKLINEDALRYAINTIKAIQDDLFIEEQVDFIGLIKQSLNRIPSAIDKVREICEANPLVSEQVEVILSSGYSFEECFAL